MVLPIDTAWLYALLLLSTRLAPVFFLTPVLGLRSVPGSVKALLCLALSAMIVAGSGLMVALPDSVWRVFSQVLAEAMTGMVLGYGVLVVFGALSLAGRIIDTQMGFGLAGIIDPTTRQSSALTGLMFEMLAIAYLYAINGHYMLLKVFAGLISAIPLGQYVSFTLLELAIRQFAVVFMLGVALSAPVMITLFILDVGIALASRSMPQFNAFIIAMPIKVAAGLMLLITLMPSLGAFFERWLIAMIDYWAMFAEA